MQQRSGIDMLSSNLSLLIFYVTSQFNVEIVK